MITTTKDALTILKNNKKTLRQEYKVKEIGIFGSFVKNEQKRGSDIDILVDFYEVPDILELIKLERHLKQILGHKVDLIRKPAIRTELKKRILSEVLYA